jgi:quercetin dioxygenase-like cupin family protein
VGVLRVTDLEGVETSILNCRDQDPCRALHSHPHVQASYVAEGEFEVTIDERTQTVSAGGTFIVPSNAVHGVKALTAGRLIDSFTPHRKDFL